MGVVHHANYVTWFEIARTEWMRTYKMAYSNIEASGLMLPLRTIHVDYRKPAHYDQLVAIYTKIKSYSPTRLEFYYEVRGTGEAPQDSRSGQQNQYLTPEGDLLVSGTSTHIWIDKNWRPVRIDLKAPEVYNIVESRAS